MCFKDGKNLKRVEEAVYIGANITRKVDPLLKIKRRITMTMPILRKLDIFWNQTKCCNAWKIQVVNAVLVSKIIYSLERLSPQGELQARLTLCSSKASGKSWM